MKIIGAKKALQKKKDAAGREEKTTLRIEFLGTESLSSGIMPFNIVYKALGVRKTVNTRQELPMIQLIKPKFNGFNNYFATLDA